MPERRKAVTNQVRSDGPDRSVALRPWQVTVLGRIAQLELANCLLGSQSATADGVGAAERAEAPVGPSTETHPEPVVREILSERARDYLIRARRVAGSQRQHQKGRARWRGSDIEEAWTYTHAAEALIVGDAPPDSPAGVPVVLDAVATATARLKATDPHLVELRRATDTLTVDSSGVPGPVIALTATTLAAAYEAADLEQRQVRDFRNILIWVTLVLTVFAGILGGIAVAWHNIFGLCWADPPGSRNQVCPMTGFGPSSGDVLVIELMGLLGATITGAAAVRGLRGTATPYAVPMMSLLVKLPIGALTAIGGLILLHLLNSFTIHSSAEMAGYALVFGASQQTFTRLIDKQAQNILDSVPSMGKDAAKDPDAGGKATEP